jgi:hypothetical protein
VKSIFVGNLDVATTREELWESGGVAQFCGTTVFGGIELYLGPQHFLGRNPKRI